MLYIAILPDLPAAAASGNIGEDVVLLYRIGTTQAEQRAFALEALTTAEFLQAYPAAAAIVVSPTLE